MLAINKWFDFPHGFRSTIKLLKLLKTVQGIIPITNYDITQETSFMLKQGLYEQVVNTEIKDELRQLPEDSKHVEKIDTAESLLCLNAVPVRSRSQRS